MYLTDFIDIKMVHTNLNLFEAEVRNVVLFILPPFGKCIIDVNNLT